jgi:GntR family transcriptional regulator/MocR family aminotransferase
MLPYKSLILLDRNATIPLYIQLCNKFIDIITRGLLAPNDMLPSSRKLSDLLSINRNTVKLAFEELISQGWAESIDRKGIFVLSNLPKVTQSRQEAILDVFNNNIAFFWNNELVKPLPKINLFPVKLAIDDGFPDVRLAPIDLVMREYRSLSNRHYGKGYLKYGNPLGSENLRIALGRYLFDTRGLHVAKENILITRGSQMAIYLASRLLLNPHENIAVGSSNYFAADATFKLVGANLLRIPVDENGMNIDYLESLLKHKTIKAVYVIPHHHCPTTVTLSMDRRLKLLNLANQYQFAIIEDDYDFDFHYGNKPFLPLRAIDHNGNVLYVGSLCKTLAPAIRIGFLIGPPEFIEKAAALRRIIDRQGDTLLEESIAALFENGEMNRHFRKSIKIYKERRDLFCSILLNDFKEQIQFQIPEGGLAIWAKFNDEINLIQLAENALAKGLYLSNGNYYKNETFQENYTRLGFASLSESEIIQSLALLKDVI